jgi:hypothetical protein
MEVLNTDHKILIKFIVFLRFWGLIARQLSLHLCEVKTAISTKNYGKIVSLFIIQLLTFLVANALGELGEVQTQVALFDCEKAAFKT